MEIIRRFVQGTRENHRAERIVQPSEGFGPWVLPSPEDCWGPERKDDSMLGFFAFSYGPYILRNYHIIDCFGALGRLKSDLQDSGCRFYGLALWAYCFCFQGLDFSMYP